MTKIDETGTTIKITSSDMIRIDGYTLCKRVVKENVVWLQFCDRDSIRNSCRGTRYIEIRLEDFYNIIKNTA